jgi:rhodanese-related sulfurtransferase
VPREIRSEELAARMREGKPVVLVDVREGWEREICALPGSLHIPIEELPGRAGEIPRGAPVVLY